MAWAEGGASEVSTEALHFFCAVQHSHSTAPLVWHAIPARTHTPAGPNSALDGDSALELTTNNYGCDEWWVLLDPATEWAISVHRTAVGMCAV